ncbi:MAG TPA: glycoside-pentoside-hexuronide (GPH):cation symporter [Anaerolineales bacterium]|nr:glycoside-pentoside-hexuronide (GPH):cation symporter [Anaerolineales bacterium]
MQATEQLEAASLVKPQPIRLSLLTKLVYGSGDWGMASFGTLRQVFYAIFLTDVVGLEPRLASFAALFGIIWDAINDPLVGALSDRVRTRWGRRRPFLLFFSIPFGLSFLLLWWAPPWESQVARMLTVLLAFMISDTLQTLITVPFFALTPEITQDYDERTTLTGYRMFFNLLASLATAVSAPMIVDMAIKAGLNQQQGYLIVAGMFGGLAALPFLLIFLVVREKTPPGELSGPKTPFKDTLRTAWSNKPFRFAVGLYMMNWITFDLVALMLPYFLVYWVAQGDLLASVNLFGEELSLESAVLGLLLITAVLVLPFWMWLAHKLDKRSAYIAGMTFWALVQVVIFFVKPGQIGLILVLAMFAGLSVSTAHALPEAIFPDVIEWDELRTRRRNEGVYYGVKNFIHKLTGAVAIFFALQVLGWIGYQAPPADVTRFSQSPETLTAIRWLTGPAGALLLVSAIAIAWFYPLSRERHARIRRLLAQRRKREGADDRSSSG